MDGATLTGIASAVIALSALLFSVYSFNAQQSRAEKHASATVRPILKIRTLKYIDNKAIKIINAGIGPAIVNSAKFSRNETTTNSVVELFDLDVVWNSFINVPKDTAIPAQEELVLVSLTLGHLVSQGFENARALELLEEWQRQKSEIAVRIEYSDIYGNMQEPIDLALK